MELLTKSQNRQERHGQRLPCAAAGCMPWSATFQADVCYTTSCIRRYGANEFNSSLGRWVQQDSAGYINGVHLYQMERSDPADHVDPRGLASSGPTDQSYNINSTMKEGDGSMMAKATVKVTGNHICGGGKGTIHVRITYTPTQPAANPNQQAYVVVNGKKIPVVPSGGQLTIDIDVDVSPDSNSGQIYIPVIYGPDAGIKDDNESPPRTGVIHAWTINWKHCPCSAAHCNCRSVDAGVKLKQDNDQSGHMPVSAPSGG